MRYILSLIYYLPETALRLNTDYKTLFLINLLSNSNAFYLTTVTTRTSDRTSPEILQLFKLESISKIIFKSIYAGLFEPILATD